jgi:hypothetical protein
MLGGNPKKPIHSSIYGVIVLYRIPDHSQLARSFQSKGNQEYMPSTPSILEYITLGIAIWGALLSTTLAIKSLQKDKRQIIMTCRLIEQTLSQDGVPQNMILGIKAVNKGHRDVKLEYAGLITRSKKYYIANTLQILPFTLGDGASITIRLKLDDAEKRLREISSSEIYASACVKDTEDTFYRTSHLPDVMINRKMAKRVWKIKQ